jgi:hypothetical protein
VATVIPAGGKTWVTANEAPDWLGSDVTPEVVRAWASRGKVNGHRVGRETYYDLDDLTETEYATRTSTRGHKRVAA